MRATLLPSLDTNYVCKKKKTKENFKMSNKKNEKKNKDGSFSACWRMKRKDQLNNNHHVSVNANEQ